MGLDVCTLLKSAFVAKQKIKGKAVANNPGRVAGSMQARAEMDGLEAEVLIVSIPLEIDRVA